MSWIALAEWAWSRHPPDVHGCVSTLKRVQGQAVVALHVGVDVPEYRPC